MKVIILILTLVFPDDTLQSKVFQAPMSETMEHCEGVVVPSALRSMRRNVTFAKGISGVCFEVTLDLKTV
jgi:hypothetical protein|tara:strand:+ start:1007 stop:1216 length:210 start_codon:yes stop_codon:yes gene_type:complete